MAIKLELQCIYYVGVQNSAQTRVPMRLLPLLLQPEVDGSRILNDGPLTMASTTSSVTEPPFDKQFEIKSTCLVQAFFDHGGWEEYSSMFLSRS